MPNLTMENKLIIKNTSYFDVLRVIATIGVIFIHVASNLVSPFGRISQFNWWVGNIFDSSVRFCVPIFVMLSGALLIPKNFRTNEFLKSRMIRVILPFIFFSVIYTLYLIILKYVHGETIMLNGIITFFFDSLRLGSSFHLWYIYMILGIYLFIPVIGKWARVCEENEIRYFLIIWFISILISLPIFSRFRISIDLSYFSGYIGYLILGYYLSIREYKDNKSVKKIALLLISIGILSTAFGTYYLSASINKFSHVFYEYLSPNVLLLAVGVFLFIKNMEIENKTFLRIIVLISRHCYGIYLIHIMVLNFMNKIGLNCDFINPILATPLTVIICLLISFIIISILNKIPYGKYISG